MYFHFSYSSYFHRTKIARQHKKQQKKQQINTGIKSGFSTVNTLTTLTQSPLKAHLHAPFVNELKSYVSASPPLPSSYSFLLVKQLAVLYDHHLLFLLSRGLRFARFFIDYHYFNFFFSTSHNSTAAILHYSLSSPSHNNAVMLVLLYVATRYSRQLSLSLRYLDIEKLTQILVTVGISGAGYSDKRTCTTGVCVGII